MCGHVSTADTCPCVLGYSDDVLTLPPPPPPPPQEQFPPLQILLNHHQQMIAAAADFDFSDESAAMFGYSGSVFGGGSSGCDSPSSLGSGGGGEQSLMQRSVSSNDGFFGHFATAHGPTYYSGPVRRALSAGDLHRMNKKKGEEEEEKGRRGERELWSESNAIIQGMNRTVRYSPEEKRERILRYKSKRNLRNFNKRIKYECRKTLADSRPRIRGRFARNDDHIKDNNNMSSQLHVLELETETETETKTDQDFDSTNWASFLDYFSPN